MPSLDTPHGSHGFSLLPSSSDLVESRVEELVHSQLTAVRYMKRGDGEIRTGASFLCIPGDPNVLF